MPGSRASVFGEAEDFPAALSTDSVAGLLVTGRGQSRARLTQVRLDGWQLRKRGGRGSRSSQCSQARSLSPFRSPKDRRRSGLGSTCEWARYSLSALASGYTQEQSGVLTGAPFSCQSRSFQNIASR